jgi:hypothetical protein
MSEKLIYPEIIDIGDTPRKRDFCNLPCEAVQVALESLLILEELLIKDDLTSKQREAVVLSHTMTWVGLPYEYKSELADLTAKST